MASLPPYPTFDYETDKTNAGPRWEKWVNRLDNLFIGLNITNDARKRALLLHYAVECVHEIFDAEKSQHDAELSTTYDGTKGILNKYFIPQTNLQMEIYNFRTCHQQEGQSLDEYITELQQLSKNCKFSDVDAEILSQLIQRCQSNRLRRGALRETDKKLSDLCCADQQVIRDCETCLQRCNDGHSTDVLRVCCG